jgi:hypothetical protein
VITGVPVEYPELYATYSGCSGSPKRRTISATITGATSAVLRWSGPVPSGAKAMSPDGTTWSAVLGPFEQTFGGTIDLTIEAVDSAGNPSSSSSMIELWPCPG